MEKLKPIIGVFSISAIIFLFMYPILITRVSKKFSEFNSIISYFILGLLSGAVSLVTMFISIYYYNDIYLDGKFTIILISGIIFGRETSAVTGIVILIGGVITGKYTNSVFIPQIIIAVLISMIINWLKVKKGILFVKKYLIPFYLLVLLQATLWGLIITNGETVFKSYDTNRIIQATLMVIINYALLRMFIYELQRKENEELSATYGELAVTEEELRYQYDNLVANEEEIRFQYDKLYKSNLLLKMSEERNQLIFKAGKEALWDYNPLNNEFFSSAGLEEIYEAHIDKSDSFFDLSKRVIHPEDREKSRIFESKIISEELDYFNSDHRIVLPSGIKWIASKIVAVRDENGMLTHVAGSVSDITKEKEREAELHRLAYYDMLTGLPNRKHLYEKYLSALSEDLATKHKRDFLYIDLDNFKNINDTMGHTTGDILLKELGNRLMKLKSDREFIARIGGDEFIIVIDNENSEEDFAEYTINFVERLMKVVDQAFYLDNSEYNVTLSIGIASYPRDGENLEDILKNADTAMYRAKRHGKNKYENFSKEMYDNYIEKLNMEKNLKQAVINNEISVYYQPQYNEKMELVGFEALARWFSDILGTISPEKFIPIAEESGLITTIRKQLMEKACIFSKAINLEASKNLVVSVNISSMEILQPDFIESIMALIKKTGVSPYHMGIEITESSLMESFEITCEKIELLKNKGFKISLDDFGTGYSSLNYLSKIPVSIVKIDKSFVDKILIDEKHKMLTSTIIWLSHYLDIKTVAEGVETRDQLNALYDMKCDYIQGYLLGRPMAVDKALELAKACSK
jgi:diguanylate cyclase (GGDEF)-like protein